MPEDESMGLKFIVQDRPVVVDMGIKAWREKCPEFLDSGVVEFQGDFSPLFCRCIADILL